MQPGITAVLVTVWLVVEAGVIQAVTLRPLRLFHDQYSLMSPRLYRVPPNQTVWRDHDPTEDQPLDFWIESRRSISVEESPDLPRTAKRYFSLEKSEKSPKNVDSSKHIFPLSSWQRRLPNIAASEFTTGKVDYDEMPEMLPREMPFSNTDDSSLVANETFQDQGLDSVEIYKQDSPKENAPLTTDIPPAKIPMRNKNKAPKKTDRANMKTMTAEIKSTAGPKIRHEQSNFFEEQRTETPASGNDAFGVGGVPELQVGCEGLEASPRKTKRYAQDEEEALAPWLSVTPITLDLDYDLSYEEESYEEMDELLKLKRLEEATTKRTAQNRGDMDATLNSDHLDDFRRPEKLPVRGDLGDSTAMNLSGLVDLSPKPRIDREESSRKPKITEKKDREEAKVAKKESISPNADIFENSGGKRSSRPARENIERFADDGRKRMKRSVDWGFGEDEGVVSSDELQTVNKRRRQHEMRYHQDVIKRNLSETNYNVDNIRQQYERLQEQRRREEEEQQRQLQQSSRKTPSGWDEEEKRRRDEIRRRQHEEYRRRMEYTSTPRTDDRETRVRQMEERRRQEMARNRTQEIARRNEEERRRREEEERRRRLHKEEEDDESRRRAQDKWRKNERGRQEENARKSEPSDTERRQRLREEEIRRRTEERRRQDEEARRQEQYKSQRIKEEEERRRANQGNSDSNQSENNRRLEQQRREWLEKRRREDENERRRQQDRNGNEVPSNLIRTGHGQRDRDQDKRNRQSQEEREREQKLREYIARNRPINVDRRTDRISEEERRHHQPTDQNVSSRTNANRDSEEYRRQAERQRLEEERRRQEQELRDYIRRNQPVNVPSRSNQSSGRDLFEERRWIEEARQRGRYPDSETARRRGPSAPTYIDPRGSPEEVKRRQEARRLEEERRRVREQRLRYEAEQRRKELVRRQQEEERRLQEERRKEAARREEETRIIQSRRFEEDRKRLETARMQTQRERQEEVLNELGGGASRTAGGTRQPEATRSPYQDSRLLEYRRRQDSRPIPSNLVLDEAKRTAERERQRQEWARLEVEKQRQQEESRIREQKQKEALTDPWKRQDLVRLHALPVRARIILSPEGSSSTGSPIVLSRNGFENEIDFTGFHPNRPGVPALNFPARPTSRPPVPSPGPCVWAIVQCCSRNNNRRSKCFESMGCPGTNWDPNPCRRSIREAARREVIKFYEASNAYNR